LEVVPADMAAARRWPGPEDPATGQVGTLAPFVTSIGPEGTVVNLAYEHPILATVTVDGYGAWVRVLKPVEQRVQAVLEPSATIVMRLTGDVAPGDDVSVTALRVRPDGTLASVGERRGFPRGGAIEVRPDGTLVIVRVDERRGFPRDGAIEARLEDDIGPGTYELQVKSARHRAVEPRRVLVHRAREVVESSAILEARDDVGHLRVRLRAAAGGELQTGERGTVMLHRHRHDASAWRLETTTPPDEFLLENLESGTYDVLWVLESPARAALLRGVVVRPGETVERDVAAEAGVWVRMPSVADATGGSSARVVGADGKSFPLYLDGDKNFNLSDGKPPPSAGELFGPYPASAVPLTLRLAVAGRELTLPLPTVER
jgi:hypothetical protein